MLQRHGRLSLGQTEVMQKCTGKYINIYIQFQESEKTKIPTDQAFFPENNETCLSIVHNLVFCVTVSVYMAIWFLFYSMSSQLCFFFLPLKKNGNPCCYLVPSQLCGSNYKVQYSHIFYVNILLFPSIGFKLRQSTGD